MNTNCGEVSRLLKLDAYQKVSLLDSNKQQRYIEVNASLLMVNEQNVYMVVDGGVPIGQILHYNCDRLCERQPTSGACL